jgi:mono/diheme cytochrome c family protein
MKLALTTSMLGAALACSEGEAPPTDAAVQQGKTLYSNVCVVCHDADPNLPGSLGPAIAGSSRELLAAKVLRAEYPPGYTPKRPGQTMPRLAYLADGIDALAAYLASVAPASTTEPTGRDTAPR